MKLYITPNDPAVETAVADIVQNQIGFNDFEKLRDWVSSHVSYRSDLDIHGVEEYWQLPSETLQLHTGDCEDFAVLLCSLLRAYGVPSDQVYVALGTSTDSGHAYLVEKWYQGIWRITEPQAGAWGGFFLSDWATSVSYETMYCFNDQNYFQGLPALPSGAYEFQLSVIGSASVTFERNMSSGQTINASVEWLERSGNKPDFSIFGWGFRIYDSQAHIVLNWFGSDFSHAFSYNALNSGKYQVQVYTGGFLPVSAQLILSPTDWTSAPPPAAIPYVSIQSVTLPNNARANSWFTYPTTIRLANNAAIDATVKWQAHSSVTGDFDSGTVTIPKNGYQDVTRYYAYRTAGAIEITYTISYNGTALDTWLGTMSVQ